jgi:hypothetical protein
MGGGEVSGGLGAAAPTRPVPETIEKGWREDLQAQSGCESLVGVVTQISSILHSGWSSGDGWNRVISLGL